MSETQRKIMIQTLFTEHLSYENFKFEIRRGVLILCA